MPTYCYRCKSCGHEFEATQSMMEKPLSTCPECNENAIIRIIQPVGIQFKGNGFYINDKQSTSSKKS